MVRPKKSDNRDSSVSLETAMATTSSVCLATINMSPTGSRKNNEPALLKPVNSEQELAVSQDDSFDENSERLTNLAKLPPKYADVFDLPPMRGQEMLTPSSSGNLAFPDDYPITPREAYANPTYTFWRGRDESM